MRVHCVHNLAVHVHCVCILLLQAGDKLVTRAGAWGCRDMRLRAQGTRVSRPTCEWRGQVGLRLPCRVHTLQQLVAYPESGLRGHVLSFTDGAAQWSRVVCHCERLESSSSRSTLPRTSITVHKHRCMSVKTLELDFVWPWHREQ
eukprot:scaffold142585_cov25-Tisochrysis_lutea.AAC.1